MTKMAATRLVADDEEKLTHASTVGNEYYHPSSATLRETHCSL